MNKELTEQWREGTLPQGWYYVKTPCEEIKKLYCGDGESLELEDPETAGYYFFHRDLNKGQVEVLSPVPDYPELCELKQELEICKDEKADLYAKLCNALMQLEECKKKVHILNEASMKLENTVGKLCEQLNDANEVIKWCVRSSWSGNQEEDDFDRYCVKWEV